MVSEFSAPAGMTVGGIAVRTAGAAGGLGFPGAAGNTAVQEHIRPANEIQTAPNHILVGIPLHFGGMHRGAVMIPASRAAMAPGIKAMAGESFFSS